MHHLSQQLSRFRDYAISLLPKNRKHIILGVLFSALVLIGVLVFGEGAAALTMDDIINGIIYGAAHIMLFVASFFIKMTIFFLQFFILIAGYNNYINADIVKLGWNMVRDLTNMFFVVALLVIAFGTILGVESYEWRRLLPKLLLSALLVNFSNLICQVIIDAAQVFTTTFLNAVAGAAGGNLIKMFNFEQIYAMSTGESYNAPTSSSGIRGEFFIASVIAITFAAIAMITMFSYFVVMLMRMVVLWALIILSPLAFVFSALPPTKSFADDFWREFMNHVLVAPVMVFFLWLSFATFGGGNVVCDHIESGHPIDGSGVCGRVDTDGKQVSAGISRAASYESMANFAVALAFLLMGLERVQKLGVKGGGMVQGAVNFGKNVATIASGIGLAKWAGGGAMDLGKGALKGAAYHMPLGGRFWERQAKGVKGRVGTWYEKRQIRRNEAFAEKEKNLIAEGKTTQMLGNRLLGTLTGGLFGETAARADKRAKDWEVARERLAEAREETYSTSSTTGGQAKSDATVMKKEFEDMAQSKGAQKVAERREEALKVRQLFDERVDAAWDEEVGSGKYEGKSKEEMKKIEKQRKESLYNSMVNNESVRKEVTEEFMKGVPEKSKKRRQAFLDRDGGVASLAALGTQVKTKMGVRAKAVALTEQINEAGEYQKEKMAARERDKLLIARGEKPRFENLAAQKQVEKFNEQNAGLNYRELTMAAKDYAKSLKAIRGESAEAILDEDNVTEELRRAVLTNANGMIANMNKGGEYGMDVLDSNAATAKFDEAVLAGDMDTFQRKFLSGLLQRKVQKGDGKVEEAFKELQTILGEEEANIIMRNADAAFKVMAADGVVNAAGVVYDRNYNSKKGRADYQFTGVGETDGSTGFQDHYDGTRTYMAQDIKISNLTGLKDMLGKSGDGKSFVIPTEGTNYDAMLSNFSNVFGTMTRTTKIHSRLKEELDGVAEAIRGGDTALQAGFSKLLNDFAAKNRAQAGFMQEKLSDFMDAVGVNFSQQSRGGTGGGRRAGNPNFGRIPPRPMDS